MPNQHKHTPISFRAAESDREWLLAYADEHGLAVNLILSIALKEFRARREGESATQSTTNIGNARKGGLAR